MEFEINSVSQHKCYQNKTQENFRGEWNSDLGWHWALGLRVTSTHDKKKAVVKRENGYEGVYGWTPSTYSGAVYVLEYCY